MPIDPIVPPSVDFKPSEVYLHQLFVNTFSRAEAEFAMIVIVRYCARNGDRWQIVPEDAPTSVLRLDFEEKVEPICSYISNPFFRPRAGELKLRGFVEFTDEPKGLYLTDKGFEGLRKWVRRG